MIHKSKSFVTLLLVILAACLAVRAQSPSPTPRIPDEANVGSIEGKVVNENGHAMSGAMVAIRAVNSSTFGRTTTSDAGGNFNLNGLERGLYMVTANAPAYTTAPSSDPNNPTYYRIGDSVRVELIRGGAITGTVTNSQGEPMIAVRVRAILIRNAKGEPPLNPGFGQEQSTDDRGIYRIYGLAPGTYLVSAGGTGFGTAFNPFDLDIPTFAPSSTRDNAAEITVRSGEDANADIRYRGEPGHSISGTVKLSGNSNATLTLTLAGSTVPIAITFQFPGVRGFALNGLVDGEYELVAQEVVTSQQSTTPAFYASEPKRITIKGADVSGIEMVPKPLASISGRIAFEKSKAAECAGKRSPVLSETIVQLRRPEKDPDKQDSPLMRTFAGSASPETNGAFTVRSVRPGRYQFDPLFYARYWYLQSMSMSSAGVKPQKIDAAATWTTVKAGEQLSNLTITLAEGAASIRGRIPLAEGAAPPAALYLLPSEPDRADDVLRFFVTDFAVDGTFAFNNLPPGKYLALTQPSADAQTATPIKLRQPEAASARAKLRRVAETKKIEIELKPCQNLTDYQLKQ
jgi:Carboxypeptidase regulatory-like domain